MRRALELVDWGAVVIVVVLCAIAGGIVFGIYKASQDQDRWEGWCRDQGGHVTDHTSSTTVVTVDPKTGNPAIGIGSDTTYYCLSADGRILDIE